MAGVTEWATATVDAAIMDMEEVAMTMDTVETAMICVGEVEGDDDDDEKKLLL